MGENLKAVILSSRVVQTVIHIKNEETCAELGGLRKCKTEGLFIGWRVGSEEDGGRFAPTGLEGDRHVSLFRVSASISRTLNDLCSILNRIYDVAIGTCFKVPSPRSCGSDALSTLPQLRHLLLFRIRYT